MAVRLIIVRHGNTFGPGEPPRRIGARTNLPLVESGREQARALGRWFAAEKIHFAAALSAPLQRAHETAAIILEQQLSPPTLQIADWLAEIDHGPDEGQPEEAVLARIGRDALTAWDEQAVPPPDWIIDAPCRIAAWRAFFEDQRPITECNMLLVTSNGAARFALMANEAVKRQAQALPSLKLRTGAWGCINVSRDGLALDGWDRRP